MCRPNVNALLLSFGLAASQLCACAVRKHKLLQRLEPKHIQNSFFLAEESEKSRIDPASLEVLNVAILTLQLGKSRVPALQFITQGGPDYVHWEICPQGPQQSCHPPERSVKQNIIIGDLASARYQLLLKACVEKARSSDPRQQCGPAVFYDWSYIKDSESKEGPKDLRDLKQRWKDLSVDLAGLLVDLEANLDECASHSNYAESVIDDIRIQLHNLNSLGPSFVTWAAEGLVTPERRDELAEALSGERESEDTRTYKAPSGLSLADSTASAINTIYQVHSTKLVNPKRVLSHLRGSSGIHSPDGSQLANPKDLSKASLLAITLANPHLRSSDKAQFGAYALLNRITQLPSLSFGLGLTAHTSCALYETSRLTVHNVARELREIKETLRSQAKQ